MNEGAPDWVRETATKYERLRARLLAPGPAVDLWQLYKGLAPEGAAPHDPWDWRALEDAEHKLRKGGWRRVEWCGLAAWKHDESEAGDGE